MIEFIKIHNRLLYISLVLSFNTIYSQEQGPNKLLDSLYDLVYEKPNYVLQKIDSIEKTFNKKSLSEKGLYYNIKGQAYFTLNDYKKLYENFLEGIAYAKQHNDKKLEGDFYLNYTDALNTLGDWKRADTYIGLAIDSYTKIGYREGIIKANQTKALNYSDQGFYQKSNNILLKNELIYKSVEDPTTKILAYYYIFANFLQLNNKSKADVYLNKLKKIKETFPTVSSKYFEKANYDYYLNVTDIELAHYYYTSKEYDTALHYLSNMKQIFFNEDLDSKRNYIEIFIDIYSEQGNTKMYQVYKDSLSLLQEQLKLKQFNNSIKATDKSLQLKELIIDEKDSKSNFKLIGIILLTLLLSFVLFVVVKRKKYNQKDINKSKKIKEQTNKLKEQDKIALQLKGKEKVLNELKTELKSISRIRSSDTQKQKISTLFIKLHEQTNSVVYMGSYEELNLINSEFFEGISKKHPSLSESEQVLCLYIFMKFKNTQIASFLNTSVRATEGRRYRIRTKLNIKNPKTTLLEVIQNSFE